MEQSVHIIPTDLSVKIISTFRIPFETPKNANPALQNDIKKIKAAVKEAVGKIVNKPNCIFRGIYGSDQKKYGDTENALFYNFSTAAFQKMCSDGIGFRELSESETRKCISEVICKYSISETTRTKSTGCSPLSYHYYYEYSYLDIDSLNPYLTSEPIDGSLSLSDDNQRANSRLIAKWENLPIDTGKMKNAFDWWLKMKQAKNGVAVFKELSAQKYILILQLETPNKKAVRAASIQKPIIDGIVCAFHSADKKMNISKLSETMCCDAEMLRDDSIALLGNQNYVYPFGRHVKWNPKDDNLQEFYLIIKSSEDKNEKLSGKLFDAE